MIRGIIGACAVLAAFAVIENSSDPSTGNAGLAATSCKSIQAYAYMQPGEGLIVRAEPSPDAEVIGNLGVLEEESDKQLAAIVTVTASQSGWARIALQSSKEYATADGVAHQHGWIPADQLTVDARVDGAITAYSLAFNSTLSKESGQILNALKKSLPLSSATMKAGKSSTLAATDCFSGLLASSHRQIARDIAPCIAAAC